MIQEQGHCIVIGDENGYNAITLSIKGRGKPGHASTSSAKQNIHDSMIEVSV